MSSGLWKSAEMRQQFMADWSWFEAHLVYAILMEPKGERVDETRISHGFFRRLHTYVSYMSGLPGVSGWTWAALQDQGIVPGVDDGGLETGHDFGAYVKDDMLERRVSEGVWSVSYQNLIITMLMETSEEFISSALLRKTESAMRDGCPDIDKWGLIPGEQLPGVQRWLEIVERSSGDAALMPNVLLFGGEGAGDGC